MTTNKQLMKWWIEEWSWWCEWDGTTNGPLVFGELIQTEWSFGFLSQRTCRCACLTNQIIVAWIAPDRYMATGHEHSPTLLVGETDKHGCLVMKEIYGMLFSIENSRAHNWTRLCFRLVGNLIITNQRWHCKVRLTSNDHHNSEP